MNRVYKTMTRVCHSGFTVRVWREEPVLTFGPDYEIHDIIIRYFQNEMKLPLDMLVDNICMLDRINAVEILDATGNGGLFYPDWK